MVDAAAEYAQHIPVRVIAQMLGFPEEDADQFRGFVQDALEGVDLPQEQRIENFGHLDAYLTAQVQDHVAHPRDDLTSYLLQAEMDGQPLEPEHVGGTIALLLIAGIDTTWSAIGASLWHLADHPDDRAAPGRRARAASRSPSRSCCGPTRRSPWPGSSTTTSSSTAAP